MPILNLIFLWGDLLAQPQSIMCARMRFRHIIKSDGGLKKYLYNCWENCHIKPVRLLAPIMIKISSEYPLHTHTYTVMRLHTLLAPFALSSLYPVPPVPSLYLR